MKIRELLEEEHSKAQSIRISEEIGESSDKLAELVSFVTGKDRRLAQRAAWAITCSSERYPSLVRPFLGELLRNLSRPDLHDAVKRNTLKVAAELPLPQDAKGIAVETAFRVLNTPEEAVAARVHAMSILEQACLEEPDLIEELRLVIRYHLPLEPNPGFQSKGRRVLKRLERIWSAEHPRS